MEIPSILSDVFDREGKLFPFETVNNLKENKLGSIKISFCSSAKGLVLFILPVNISFVKQITGEPFGKKILYIILSFWLVGRFSINCNVWEGYIEVDKN